MAAARLGFFICLAVTTSTARPQARSRCFWNWDTSNRVKGATPSYSRRTSTSLVERYAAVCPHVIKFEDARARTAVDGGDASEAKRLNEAANKDCVSDFGMAREARETERAHVLEAVASECARFAAITKGYVFGSFARGDFAA